MAGYSALIIDDKRNVRDVCEAYLKNMGCFKIIAKAPDGVSGIRMLENQKFDLILLDFDLPKKNGMELVRDLIALKTDQYQKVVIVSGKIGRDEVQEFATLGIKKFLMKPFDEAEMQQKVLSVISPS